MDVISIENQNTKNMFQHADFKLCKVYNSVDTF